MLNKYLFNGIDHRYEYMNVCVSGGVRGGVYLGVGLCFQERAVDFEFARRGV